SSLFSALREGGSYGSRTSPMYRARAAVTGQREIRMKILNLCVSALAMLGLILGGPANSSAQPQPATFTTIDFPGALSTGGNPSNWFRINAEGQIAGGYQDASGKGHGFLLTKGDFVTIDYPGAIFSELNQINDRGDILATWVDASFKVHGFLV